MFQAPFVDARRSARQHQRPARQGAAHQRQRRRLLHEPARATCSRSGTAEDPSGDLRDGLPQPVPDPGRRQRRRLRHRLLARLATSPENFRGPAGTGRVEIVRKPSNYGWPLCYSPNLPYYRWNFNTRKPLDPTPQPVRVRQPGRAGRRTPRAGTRDGGPTIEPASITPADHPAGHLVLLPRQRQARRSARRAWRTTTAPAARCPQLFPELYTAGVAPHGAAPYRLRRGQPEHDEVPAVLRRRVRPRRVHAGHAARGPRRRAEPDLQDQPAARLRRGAVEPRRSRSSATTRWTCSSAPTATSTC